MHVVRNRALRLFAFCAAVSTALSSASAQPRADLQAAPRFTLDAGANAVAWTAFPGVATASPRQSGVSIAPGLHLDGLRHSVDVTGSWTNDPTGGGIVQGGALVSVYTASRVGVRGEFTGNASGSRLADGFTSARALGGVRVHASRGNGGGWLGAQAGVAGYDSAWRRVQQPELGVWYALPSRDERAVSSGAVVLTVTPTRIAVDGENDSYTDVEAGARYTRGRAEMGVSLGTRVSRSATVALLGGAQAWGTVATTIWMTPQLAITGSAGTYPVDAMMRFPGGRFASAGIRMAFGRAPVVQDERASSVGSSTVAAPAAVASTARPLLMVSSGAGDDRTVRVTAPTAVRRVEIAGSFSNWEPVVLARSAAGTFEGMVRLRPGQYQVAIRMDSGQWVAPRDLVSVRDEFGGESGLLVVGR